MSQTVVCSNCGADKTSVAPQDIVSEKLVLGSCLQDPEAVRLALQRLRPTDFYHDAHRIIFKVILELARRGIPVSDYTVTQELIRRRQLEQAGGSAYIQTLILETPTAAHAPLAIEAVRECAERRSYLGFFQGAIETIQRNGAHADTLRAQWRRDMGEIGLLAEPQVVAVDPSIGADAFLVPPLDLQWDIQGVRVQGDHGWTAGAPKSMKGLFSMEEARAQATGTPFLGHFPTRRCRVDWISEEDRVERLHRRFYEAMRGRPPEEIPGPDDLQFLIKAGVRLDTERGQGILRQHLERHHPEMVILEHFDKLHSGNANKAEEVKPLLDVLDGFSREFGCTFRVQKHLRKVAAGQSKRKGEMLAGTVAQHGWGESSVYLTLIKKGLAMVEVEAKDGDTAPRFLVQYQNGRLVYAGEAGAEAKIGRREQAITKVLEAVQQQPGASVEELSDVVKLSEKTVRRHLKALECDGDVVGQQESSKQPKRFWPKSLETDVPMGGQEANCPSKGQPVLPW